MRAISFISGFECFTRNPQIRWKRLRRLGFMPSR
jgi:hypothetical protein